MKAPEQPVIGLGCVPNVNKPSVNPERAIQKANQSCLKRKGMRRLDTRAPTHSGWRLDEASTPEELAECPRLKNSGPFIGPVPSQFCLLKSMKCFQCIV